MQFGHGHDGIRGLLDGIGYLDRRWVARKLKKATWVILKPICSFLHVVWRCKDFKTQQATKIHGDRWIKCEFEVPGSWRGHHPTFVVQKEAAEAFDFEVLRKFAKLCFYVVYSLPGRALQIAFALLKPQQEMGCGRVHQVPAGKWQACRCMLSHKQKQGLTVSWIPARLIDWLTLYFLIILDLGKSVCTLASSGLGVGCSSMYCVAMSMHQICLSTSD